MQRGLRHPALILLVGLVLFGPCFEIFDNGQDLEQGTDFVLALLAVFISTTLFVVCKRLVFALRRLLRVAGIPVHRLALILNRSIPVEVSPPEYRILLLGNLRI